VGRLRERRCMASSPEKLMAVKVRTSCGLLPGNGSPALYLRSVCVTRTAFSGLGCHPPACMLLKIRLTTDSNPIAPTIFFSPIPGFLACTR
jgi:hypothetical protein